MALNGSIAKLHRAKEHFDTLATEIKAFFEANPYNVVVERPVDGLYVTRIKDAPEIPAERWSLLIGDCVHNLRCALDYIVWELSGASLRDTTTQFPVFDTIEGWKDRGLKKIAKLRKANPKVAILIEGLQPYVGGDPQTAALGVLRKLDDADKHKLLTVTVVTHKALSHKWSLPVESPAPTVVRANVVTKGPLLPGEVVSTLVLESAPAEMEMKASLSPRVAFGERLGVGYPVDVLESLPVLLREVDAIVGEVERLIAVGDATLP